MKRFRNLGCFFLAIAILIISLPSFAEEKGISLSKLQSEKGFYYSDDKKTMWTYYTSAYATGSKGEEVEISLLSWGKDRALTDHPEIRFFISDSNGIVLRPLKVTMMIGSNMFELILEKLMLDNNEGGYVTLVWEDDILLKALATCNACHMIIQCEEKSVQVVFTEEALAEIKKCAVNMVRYDFTKTIDKGNSEDTVNALLDPSSISAHVFEEIDESSIWTETDNVSVNQEFSWTEYFVEEIGVKVFLPMGYEVYTRTMNDEDPAAVKIGLSATEIANMLQNKDYYLDAFDQEKNEIALSAGNGVFNSFSVLTDEVLLNMASLYSDSLGEGVTIHDTSVYRKSDIAYIKVEGVFRDNAEEEHGIIQYFTGIEGKTIVLNLFTSSSKLREKDREFMAELMDRVEINNTSGLNNQPEEQSIGVEIGESAEFYEYETTPNGSARVTKYKGTEKEVMIPGYIDGRRVTEIGAGAFVGTNNMVSLYIPDEVTELGYYAIAKCQDLKVVRMPQSVTKLESATFSNCISLENVTLPKGLTNIPDTMFYSCTSLKSINLSEEITAIGVGSFEKCESLEHIVIPEAIVTIADRAFRYCSALTEVKIPKDLTSIGSWAFDHCTSLTSIVIPRSVVSIGLEAFSDCPKLTVTVERGSYAEQYCQENGLKYLYE